MLWGDYFAGEHFGGGAFRPPLANPTGRDEACTVLRPNAGHEVGVVAPHAQRVPCLLPWPSPSAGPAGEAQPYELCT